MSKVLAGCRQVRAGFISSLSGAFAVFAKRIESRPFRNKRGKDGQTGSLSVSQELC
jgi:hypothetical protein